jgi:hypothetical protein
LTNHTQGKTTMSKPFGKASKTIDLAVPVDIFEVDGAEVSRRKKISVMEAMRLHMMRPDMPEFVKDADGRERSPEETLQAYLDAECAVLAKFYPRWSGVVSVEGEPLPNPEDDPAVLLQISMAERAWLKGKGLSADPN